jgi:S1-C subfamily serine protease
MGCKGRFGLWATVLTRNPAGAGTLKPGGDIILSVDGIPVVSEDNIEQIRNRLASGAPGSPFKMRVLRGGKVIDLVGTME